MGKSSPAGRAPSTAEAPTPWSAAASTGAGAVGAASGGVGVCKTSTVSSGYS